ncbi:IPT/TIG domain-containing protein [Sorangium sp. So ce1335]|uniref:IPT/TIG domain-containing protein n=1 Tax=Sorangium sp. So ce1335 TaxID=3133335 RepID=UPI003F5F4861
MHNKKTASIPFFGDIKLVDPSDSGTNIDLSGKVAGVTPPIGQPGSSPGKAASGANGYCNTWSRCGNSSSDRDGAAGDKGGTGVPPSRATDGQSGGSTTAYVRDLLTPIVAYSTGAAGGIGAAGGPGGTGGEGGNGGSGGNCCSAGSGGKGGDGGDGSKGGAGGNGGDGGIITILYTNANGFNLTGNVAGGPLGPGGPGGRGGDGGKGGSNGGGGTAAGGAPGGSGPQGDPGTPGRNGELNFRVNPPAVSLTAISPNNGPAAGGTSVTISGTNFVVDGSGKVATEVRIGGVAVTNLVYVSDTTLRGTTPPGSGAAFVVAINPDGSTGVLDSKFTYT